ncbi:amino acid ABC transporter ATP-binding protein [Mesoaciditoga sp.]
MSVISAKGVRKSFGEIEVLRGISMEVEKGEVVVLMGPSGTGKSTFLRTLNFLEIPDGGEIVFGDIRMKNDVAILRKARSRMAFVSQSYNLFPHMTALKNVVYPLVKVKKMEKSEARKKAVEVLSRVGLKDKINSYPGQLSGGQKQRVAIARAIAMQPDLILFDEPTSALDPEMTSEVLKVMKELANMGTTMIVVTHEVGFARDAADRVVFMSDGIILENTEPKEFFKRPKSEKAVKFLARL